MFLAFIRRASAFEFYALIIAKQSQKSRHCFNYVLNLLLLSRIVQIVRQGLVAFAGKRGRSDHNMRSSFLLNRPLYTFIAAIVLAVVSVTLYSNAIEDRNAESGVFRVINYGNKAGTKISSGTAFKVAEPGVVITNFHVIRGAVNLVVLHKTDDGARKTPMRVIWQDREQDLAILKGREDIPGEPLILASIEQEDLHKKDVVEAIGFPGVSDDLAEYSTSSSLLQKSEKNSIFTDATVTMGKVQRQIPGPIRSTIQHDAIINHGNSGGPLLDSCQRVVGVNTFGIGETRGGAVHVHDVLSALDDENISVRQSSGRCRAGLTPEELWGLGATSALALAFFSLSGLSVVLRSRHPNTVYDNGYQDTGQDGYGDPQYTEIAPQYGVPSGVEENNDKIIELVNRADGNRFTLLPFEEHLDDLGVTIGRSGGHADIMIDDNTISRRHAVIKRHPGGGLIISDLGSTNGTVVDGVSVRAGNPLHLEDGANIALGSCELVVRLKASTGAGVIANGSDWLLSGFDGNGKVFQLPLHSGSQQRIPGDYLELASIGRAPENDCVIDDPSVSRHHALVVLDRNFQLCLIDKNSSNGTLADGKHVGSQLFMIEDVRKLQFGEISASLSKVL